MPKNKKKQENWWLWFVVGLASYLLIAPNTTVIRLLVTKIEPVEFTFLRAAMIVVIALPIVLFSIPKYNKKNLLHTLGAGISMTVATISLSYAVKYSDASYTALMGLLSPILLVVFSSRFMGDKISHRAMAGVALATAGALVVIVAPSLLSGKSDTHFYLLATILMLINSVAINVGILFTRRSNEAGMPLAANSGMMSFIIMITSFCGMYAVGSSPANIVHFTPLMWLGIFYSGVIVVFVARIMSMATYVRIGAATTGGLNYLGTIIAIVIPLIVLGEQLASTVVLGGILILIGVFLTEKHREKHRKYMHAH